MRRRVITRGILGIFTITITACDPTPDSRWVLLSEDSDGKPTFIDAESVRLDEDGVVIYARAMGDPLSADGVEFLQALDCVKLRWAFLTLDESSLDSIAATELLTEEWSLLALTPANRLLLDAVCEDFSPSRWIRILRKDTEEPGDLKEVWVDRQSIMGPFGDSVRTQLGNLGFSSEVRRSWTQWRDASPDSGYAMVQADVACDLGGVRYLENSRYSMEGERVSEAETTDLWFSMYPLSFEEEVFSTVCEMGRFFQSDPTPETSPGGG